MLIILGAMAITLLGSMLNKVNKTSGILIGVIAN